jgi:hypothetical protein
VEPPVRVYLILAMVLLCFFCILYHCLSFFFLLLEEN